MLKIFAVMMRNLKLLLRSKISALIIILGPLFIIFLAGLAFNTSSLYSINVGIYDPANSELSNSFVEEMRASQFATQDFGTQEECVQSVRWGQTHLCMVFPEEFYIQSDAQSEITFYADTSKVNLVYMVLDSVSTQVSSRSTELSAGLTEVLLSAIDSTIVTIENDTTTLTQQGAKRTKSLAEMLDAKNTLETLNLNTPDTSYDDLEDGTDDFEDYIDDLTDAGNDAISEFKSLMTKVENNAEDIIDDLEGTNISESDAESILDFINDSRELLEEIEARFDEAEGNASEGIDGLDDLIEDVGEDFNDVAFLLSKAKTGRGQAIDNLEEIQKTLNESEVLAKKIQSNHDELAAKIDAIRVRNADAIARPITTNIQGVTAHQSNLSYLYPSLILLVLMFICLMLSSTLVIMERKSMAAFRNFCTPTRDISFTLGTYFTSLFIITVQLSVILIVSSFVFKADFMPNLHTLITILFVMSTLFILIGMALGHFFGSEETVMLASVSVGSVFLLISDLILPMESMPADIAYLAGFNPFVLGSTLLKQTILFNFQLTQFIEPLKILLLYSVIVFVVAFVIQKFMKIRFLRMYARYNVQKNKKTNEVLKLDPTEDLVVGNKTVKNLGELSELIKGMSMNTFQQHFEKHTFDGWVNTAYGDSVLAGKLAKSANQRRQINLLHRAHKAREKIRKKSRK